MKVRFSVVAALSAVAVSLLPGSAHGQPPPGVGQPCAVQGATTQDADGRTMWCNPTMTGTHSLVWQYTPSP
jgi:hypothetical protein